MNCSKKNLKILTIGFMAGLTPSLAANSFAKELKTQFGGEFGGFGGYGGPPPRAIENDSKSQSTFISKNEAILPILKSLGKDTSTFESSLNRIKPLIEKRGAANASGDFTTARQYMMELFSQTDYLELPNIITADLISQDTTGKIREAVDADIQFLQTDANSPFRMNTSAKESQSLSRLQNVLKEANNAKLTQITKTEAPKPETLKSKTTEKTKIKTSKDKDPKIKKFKDKNSKVKTSKDKNSKNSKTKTKKTKTTKIK